MRSFLNFLRRVADYRFMISSLVIRDIRARYIGSTLGLFWSVIHPVTQLLIYYFVFSVVLRVRLGPEYGGAHYAVWLIVGLLPWMFFSEVVNRSPQAVLEQANLVRKTVFPSEILPFTHVVAAVINHLIAIVILILFLAVTGEGLPLTAGWAAPYLFSTALLALGLAWLLSALNVFLRDIGQLLGAAMQVWFYLTPIIYPQSVVPERVRPLFEANPVFHAIEGYRHAFISGLRPDLGGLAYLSGVALVVFFTGGLLFRKLKPGFPDVL